MAENVKELVSKVSHASEKGFETFCEDIATMFDVKIEGKLKGMRSLTAKELKRDFRKLLAACLIKGAGTTNGIFDMLLDCEGLFTLAGTFVMLPEQIIREHRESGSLDKAQDIEDAISEVGNLLVGSWDRAFRKCCRDHDHFVQAGTFIGNPWSDSMENLGFSDEEQLEVFDFEMTVEPFEKFKCAMVYPTKVLEGGGDVEVDAEAEHGFDKGRIRAIAGDEDEQAEGSEDQSAEAEAVEQTEAGESVDEPSEEAAVEEEAADGEVEEEAADGEVEEVDAEQEEEPVGEEGDEIVEEVVEEQVEEEEAVPQETDEAVEDAVGEGEVEGEVEEEVEAAVEEPVEEEHVEEVEEEAEECEPEASEAVEVPEPVEQGPVSDAIKRMTGSGAALPGSFGDSEALSKVTAGDIMQKDVAWAGPEDTIEHVFGVMQQKNSGYVLVGSDGKCEGIVSRSDIRGAMSPYLQSMFVKWRRPLDLASLQIKVKWIMSKPVRAVKADMAIGSVMQIMCEHGGRGMPVLDDSGKVQGLVGVFDIFSALLGYKGGE